MHVLKRYISEVLSEDLSGFLKDTKGVTYSSGSSANLEYDKKAMILAKDVKRYWSKHADHNFMKSLNKVHWLRRIDDMTRFVWFLNNPGKDEIATSAYLPNDSMSSTWGTVGVLLDGRVTLAANKMDTVHSGYAHEYIGMPDKKERYKPSGLPRRAGIFNLPMAPASDFVLDRASFNPSEYDDNEFIIDNWKVKALVVGENAKSWEDPRALNAIISVAKENGLPIVNHYGKVIAT